jgi:hypothetical protein
MCAVLNLNSAWGVVAGDASKELGFQAARVKREEEEIYSSLITPRIFGMKNHFMMTL